MRVLTISLHGWSMRRPTTINKHEGTKEWLGPRQAVTPTRVRHLPASFRGNTPSAIAQPLVTAAFSSALSPVTYRPIVLWELREGSTRRRGGETRDSRGRKSEQGYTHAAVVMQMCAREMF